jgi:hypothetical protein
MTWTSSALTQRHVMKTLYWKFIDEGALGQWQVILTGRSIHDVANYQTSMERGQMNM